MTTKPIPSRREILLNVISPFMRFFTESTWARRKDEPGICDFTFGNPHEMPLPGFVDALQRWSVPQNKDWYAYKMNESGSRAVVAASLSKRFGLPFEDDDIFLTTGAFAGLAVILGAITDAGDEVIFVSPPWFFYEGMIVHAGSVPVRVKMNAETFNLDLDTIAAAITLKTRAVIVNSPHNPTGKIYPPETLDAVAQMLTAASERNDRTIYLLSDEAYSRIIFDQRQYHSPTTFYPNSFLVYTYTKVLLTPGQRLGYVALAPKMPNREQVRTDIFMSQLFTGYAIPNALLQYALNDIEGISIDVPHLQRKRDRLVEALRDIGYDVNLPEGTFYVLVRSPWPDDQAFAELLAEYDVFCLPGVTVELPGYFRISLTASDEMIDRALPRFAAAMKQARETKLVD